MRFFVFFFLLSTFPQTEHPDCSSGAHQPVSSVSLAAVQLYLSGPMLATLLTISNSSLHKLLFAVIKLVLVFLVIWLAAFSMDTTKRPHRATHTLRVLLWHWPFGKSSNLSGDVCSDLYNIRHCALTDDRSLFNQSHVVVFHHREIHRRVSVLPTREHRPSGQMWVWMSLESPSGNKKVKELNGLFNWTLSYRRDADISVPYGELVSGRWAHHPRPKTGLATWVVSNKKRTQLRSLVYASLRNHLRVDVFGKSNHRPLCPDCLLPTISNYSFYLAFENSVYQDYITEKLWRNAFMAGAVPVVLGPPRSNYEEFLPPDSFIHVDDFHSTKELADYLKEVAGNESQYHRYFEWRKTATVKLYTDWRERLCTICTKYEWLPKTKVYHDLEAWLHSSPDAAFPPLPSPPPPGSDGVQIVAGSKAAGLSLSWDLQCSHISSAAERPFSSLSASTMTRLFDSLFIQTPSTTCVCVCTCACECKCVCK
ncbi:alpha-(1,3)-fucosyltransferase 7-like isoform X1 [Acipenser oxyrinchus oxyrinchus]|uniref:Fucosyltransferase n=1 Tax=Acipenser oxyrinchus oxyrinchus TaxID=40147 RepID=A0AAD8FVQ6_ACIOX|nr:alpha-(1,3)-fucosyltransferase 7-like isoform X1 [Acipenser oxyrinchus oxyrinchus]